MEVVIACASQIVKNQRQAPSHKEIFAYKGINFVYFVPLINMQRLNDNHPLKIMFDGYTTRILMNFKRIHFFRKWVLFDEIFDSSYEFHNQNSLFVLTCISLHIFLCLINNSKLVN